MTRISVNNFTLSDAEDDSSEASDSTFIENTLRTLRLDEAEAMLVKSSVYD